MNSFRNEDPIKRDSPKTVSHYREFKQDLKQDYHSRCGYCNAADHWTGGWRFFQLDHFVPRKYCVAIKIDDYRNLVYSCFFCNNSKRAKWPTKDEKIHNDGVNGFVHPITPEYVTHLERDANGKIVPATQLGTYMIRAMKLDLARHAIIWKLEKIEKFFVAIEQLIEGNKDKIPNELAMDIIDLYKEHRKYSVLLRGAGEV